MKFRLLGSALLMASLACMPEDPSIEQLPQEIVGGQTAGPDQFRAVGSLSFTNGSQFFSFCSGTLIAPQIVLTAAHCIPAREDLPFTRFILDSVTVSNPNRVVEVEEAIAHPQFNGNNLGAGRDIAIIHLKEPVNDIPPIPVNQDPVNDLVGRTFTAVGYGVTDFEGPGGGVKRFVEMTLLGFDSQLIFYGNANSNVCQGDSGGPDLMEIDGELRVIGVHSFVQAPFCHGESGSQRPDVHQAFIDEALVLAGDVCDPTPNDVCTLGCNDVDPDCTEPTSIDDVAGGCAVSADASPKGALATLLLLALAFFVSRRRRS